MQYWSQDSSKLTAVLADWKNWQLIIMSPIGSQLWPQCGLISSMGPPLHYVSKKVPTFKLSVTLSNLNRFSKFLYCWKKYEICYKTHLTLGMLLHYRVKLKIQIFCRYLAWKRMHTNCIFIDSDFVIHPQI